MKGENRIMPKCSPKADARNHMNAFVDLNGIPYLLAEYIDARNIQQLDRSFVKSEILIDNAEAMRSIIDVSIDDIGRKASDDSLNSIGNTTKQKNLLRMLANQVDRTHSSELKVLKRGIIMRVNYQLENYHTRHTIRSMTEDLRITDRNYFLDINSNDVNNNALITNFSNTLVSTVNTFTHGIERMLIRITSIQMFYEYLKNGSRLHHTRRSLCGNDVYYGPDCYGGNYYYHNEYQHRHYLGDVPPCCDHLSDGLISPPNWTLFNRFYHFDANGKDIVFHKDEINDSMSEVILVPCGTVTVNRAFVINPGHRLIFKFSVWKNDLTVFSNCINVAKVLGAPVYDTPDEDNKESDLDKLIRLFKEERKYNIAQTHKINELMEKIYELEDIVKGYHPDEETTDPKPEPEEPPKEELPPPTHDHPHHHHHCDPKEHGKIFEELNELQSDVKYLQDNVDDLDPLTEEEIEDLFNEVKSEI